MKRILAAVLTASLTIAAPALAQDAPSREQVVAEVSRVSGLAADVVAQALDDNPAWMEQLGNAVSVAETVDKLLSGKDTEVVTDFVTGRLTDWAESFIEKALPAELTGFIGAVKVYKDALEFIRDYAFVPALEANVYAEFKRARGGRTNYTFANPSEAFIQAIYNIFGPRGGAEFKGYWPQYDAQYQRLLVSEGYNPDLVGEKLENHVKRRLDSFWAKRMEVAYRQELLKPEKENLIEAVWASVQGILDQLAAPGVDLALFVDPARELPGGWWLIDRGHLTAINRGPVDEPSSAEEQGIYTASQGLAISNATSGYAYDEGAQSWCRMEGKQKTCDLPYVQVGIVLWRYPQTEMAKAETDAMLDQAGSTRLSANAG